MKEVIWASWLRLATIQALLAIALACSIRNIVLGITLCATWVNAESGWEYARTLLLIGTSAPIILIAGYLQIRLVADMIPACRIVTRPSSGCGGMGTSSKQTTEDRAEREPKPCLLPDSWDGSGRSPESSPYLQSHKEAGRNASSQRRR